MKNRSYFRTSVAALLALGATFGLAAQASADAIDDITAAGQLNVGVFADFPPFSSASADMSLKGYDMDVAQFIADSLKVKLNPVAVTGQNRIPYLTEKRVDLLMSVGYSKEREEVIDFAAAYAPYYIAVIGRPISRSPARTTSPASRLRSTVAPWKTPPSPEPHLPQLTSSALTTTTPSSRRSFLARPS